jgi:prolipoprotein diacylglyceryl transferase
MYPDLSYFFHDIFGSSPDNWLSVIKTFGFFLILSFLAAAYALFLELKRKEKEGLLKGTVEKEKVGFPATWQEIALNAFFGFVLGFKVPYIAQNFDAFKPDPAKMIFSGEGMMLFGLLGAALFGGLKYWDKRKRQLPKPLIKETLIMPHQRIGDITILAAISGIIGARLFSIIESEENIKAFIRDPLDQLLSGSGLAIYGGLIVAFITVYLYVKSKGMKPIHVMDAVAPALILGYAVGRLGCQFSGDGDWGIVNTNPKPGWWFLPDWAWSFTYPHNVLNDGVMMDGCLYNYCHQLSEGVYPTPLYESFLGIIIFIILWSLRKRIKIPGVLFFLYTFLNGVERFFIEKIRTNPDINLLGMKATQAEYVASLLIIIGIVGITYLYIKGTRGQGQESRRT